MRRGNSFSVLWVNGPVVFQIIFIVLFSYAAARLTWLVVERVWFDSALAVASIASLNSPEPVQHISVNELVGHELFGRVESNPVTGPISKKVESIPDTRLKVQLIGVFSSDENSEAKAIIAEGAGQQRTYSIGDILARSAVVEEIHSDRVVITHQGRREVLRILWDGSTVSPSRNAQVASAPVGIPPDIAVFRDALFQGTGKLKEALGATAVKKGDKIVGFRVNEAATKAAQRFGIRPGDVLMKVNGVALNSEAQLDALLKRVPTTRRYQVQLKRNGRIKDITIGR